MHRIELNDSKAFHRHLKRHVQSPEHRMAAVVPAKFAALCQQELSSLGIGESSISEAGVEFSAKLVSCYLSNLWLRTASRILCRVARFRAGAVEQLFNRAASFHWELWLNPDIVVQIEPHVRDSRIEHEGLVAKTLLAGMQKRFVGLRMLLPTDCRPTPADPEQQPNLRQRIIIHVADNQCEISLDTSGPHLHLRGYRPRHMGAPLRETVAAAILLKAGWRADRPLVDGMCGAGTVPIEASLLARRLPPGLSRSFLFEQWPAFQQETWTYYVRKAREQALGRSPVPIVAIDRDPGAIAVARQNAVHAGVEDDITWQCMNFLSFRPTAMKLRPGLLFLNPPYGKRLIEDEDMFERLGVHLRESFRGWQVALIAPDRPRALRLKLGSARYWHIRHGGMPVVVVLAQL